jgi:chemotaxis response regulator CheB
MTKNERLCRVLIADGNADVRSALRCLLEHEDTLNIVGEAESARALFRQISSCRPDILFLDAELPDFSPLIEMQLLNWDHPGLAVILVSPDISRGKEFPGVYFRINKNDPPEIVLKALDAARKHCLERHR